jgi:hypothetical protein
MIILTAVPSIQRTQNDIFENLRPVLQPVSSEGVAFDVQSVGGSPIVAQDEDSARSEGPAATQGGVNIVDSQNLKMEERLPCPHGCDRSQRNGGYANQSKLAAHVRVYH